jgi:hypothetical protein
VQSSTPNRAPGSPLVYGEHDLARCVSDRRLLIPAFDSLARSGVA